MEPTRPQADAFGQGLYGPAWTTQTYDTLRQKMKAALADGRSVLLDASFARSADRQALAKEALLSHAEVVFIECVCDQATALERLATRWQRHLEGQPIATASDGRPELYEAQKVIWQTIQPAEIPEMKHVIVDTTLPVSRCIAQMLEQCHIPRLACWLG